MSKAFLALALAACGSASSDPPGSMLGDAITVSGPFGNDAVVTFLAADGTPIGQPAPLAGGQVQRVCPPDTTVTVIAEQSGAAWTVMGVQPGETLTLTGSPERDGQVFFPTTAPRPAGATQVHAQLGACYTQAPLSADPTALQLQVTEGCVGAAPFDDALFYAVDSVNRRVVAAAHVDALAAGGTITWHDATPQPLLIENPHAIEVNFAWAYDVAPAVTPLTGYASNALFPDEDEDVTVYVSPSASISANLLLMVSTVNDTGSIRRREYVQRHPSGETTFDAAERLLPEIASATVTQESEDRIRIKWGDAEARGMSDAVELSVLQGDSWWYFTLPATATELVTPALIPLDAEQVTIFLTFVDVDGDGYAELRQSFGVESLAKRRAQEGTFLAMRSTSVQ